MSPHRGNPIDFDTLPPASIIPENHEISTISSPSVSQPYTIPTPLPTPSLTDTINDCDIIISNHCQHATRSTTNSLPPIRQHYNNLQTINMCISINEIDAFYTVPTSNNPIPNENFDTLYEHCFLSAPPLFIRTRSYNLSKPPNSLDTDIRHGC